MDYEKRCNELIGAIKELRDNNPSDEGIQNWVNDNVSELCESDDERIRKYVINAVNQWWDRLGDPSPDYPTQESMLAWLENQKDCNTYKQVTQKQSAMWHNKEEKPVDMKSILIEYESDYNISHQVGYYNADTKTFNIRGASINPIKWAYMDELLVDCCTKEEYANKEYWRGYREGKQFTYDQYSEYDILAKWQKNFVGNKPSKKHSVLMKTTHDIAEGEWNGEQWIQYRWSSGLNDANVLYWIELSDLGKQKISDKESQEDMLAWLEKKGQSKETEISQHENKTCEENADSLTQGNEQKPTEDIDAAKASEEYRNYRMSCGITDPIMLDEIEEAYYEGAIRQISAKWSESDNDRIKELVALIRYSNYTDGVKRKVISWIESLKDRLIPQPEHEWSEEDNFIINELVSFLEKGEVKLQHDLNIYAGWLKSLRPQNRWKPSERQMWAIENAQTLLCGTEYNVAVCSLIEDLKKLKQ